MPLHQSSIGGKCLFDGSAKAGTGHAPGSVPSGHTPQDLLPAERLTSGMFSLNNTVTTAGQILKGSPVTVQLFQRYSKDSKPFRQEV